MSASASNTVHGSSSRSRPLPRRKPNDDAAYTGPSAATLAASGGGQGVKRPASERAEQDSRHKRKKVDVTLNGQSRSTVDQLSEARMSLVEFNKLSMSELYRYLIQFNIIPMIRPSPLLVDDPPPPVALANPIRISAREMSPGAVVMSANRPRRELRTRSSRLIDEDTGRTAVLADIEEVHNVIAGIVERHFRETLTISGREEVDTLASFMCAVERAKATRIRA
ncbi:hypothetical protein JOM56_006257 [Amanita muscaria]|uniref:Uncharacterized protein n=1 Tax=Amanita muscaria (strain Koide BX008) TaxID=946122 RepID=A0A0C2X8D0_AMAMK|nr:hypothetical protein M378DRAFT_66476 [Amanita muscaria Koide BX008]